MSSGLTSFLLGSIKVFQPVKSLPLKSGVKPSSSFWSSAATVLRLTTASRVAQATSERRMGQHIGMAPPRARPARHRPRGGREQARRLYTGHKQDQSADRK